MRFIHSLATFLLLTGIGFFLFDLLYHFATKGEFRVLSIEDVWTDFDKSSFETVRGALGTVLPGDQTRMFMHMPAPTVFLLISLIFYIPFKILSLMGVGKEASDRLKRTDQ